jgi:hypothetical protein
MNLKKINFKLKIYKIILLAKAPFTLALCKKLASFSGLASWLPTN